MRALLRGGASVNVQNGYGESALYRAARHGQLDVVRLLLDNDSNLGLATNDGRNALHIAVAAASGLS